MIRKSPVLQMILASRVFIRARVIFSNDRGEATVPAARDCRQLEKGEDGYYYYQEKVLSGQRTDVIFDKIVIKIQ